LPDGSLKQILPDFKKPTKLHYADPNFSPVSRFVYLYYLCSLMPRPQEEKRSRDPKYYLKKESAPVVTATEETRGKKRARAEDFL